MANIRGSQQSRLENAYNCMRVKLLQRMPLWSAQPTGKKHGQARSSWAKIDEHWKVDSIQGDNFDIWMLPQALSEFRQLLGWLLNHVIQNNAQLPMRSTLSRRGQASKIALQNAMLGGRPNK